MRISSFIAGLAVVTVHFGGHGQSRSACRGPDPLEAAVRDHPSARTWAALGGWFGEQQQYRCALSAFQTALRLDPQSAELHYYAGLTLHSEGSSQEALRELQRSTELDPGQVRPRLLAGAILNDSGKHAEAEKAWEQALRIDPNSVIALDWLAKARISDGQFEAAIDLLSSAPADEELTLDMALAYSQDGLFDKAATTLVTALAKTPADIRLNTALATVYVQSHRYQDASEVLRRALKVHPDDPELQSRYMQVLVLLDDAATGLPLAQQILKRDPGNFDALYIAGIFEIDAQQYAAAIEHLRAATALNPSHYDVRYQLGLGLFRTQQAEAAREQLEKAVSLDPNQAQAHFQLAQVLRAEGKTSDAQIQLKLYQERAQAETMRALAANKSSQAAEALRAGNAKAASGFYREAVAARPDDPTLQYNLALALEQCGDQAGERSALEQAVQLRPAFPEAEDRLGYLAANAGETAAAEQHFRSALSAAPGYAEAANNLGTLLGKQGRDHEAEIYFQSAVASNPRHAAAWINLAATLASESRFVEARAAVESALKVNPNDADALRLGHMLPVPPGGSASDGLVKSGQKPETH
jgi:tetratricopeptide (TPR) repeat protein